MITIELMLEALRETFPFPDMFVSEEAYAHVLDAHTKAIAAGEAELKRAPTGWSDKNSIFNLNNGAIGYIWPSVLSDHQTIPLYTREEIK